MTALRFWGGCFFLFAAAGEFYLSALEKKGKRGYNILCIRITERFYINYETWYRWTS